MKQQRTVPVATVRDHLDDLKERHSIAGIALAIGMTPRSVQRLYTTTTNIYRTTADRIIAAAERTTSTPDDNASQTERHDRVKRITSAASWAEAAAYAQTPAGEAFIAKCRRPKRVAA